MNNIGQLTDVLNTGEAQSILSQLPPEMPQIDELLTTVSNLQNTVCDEECRKNRENVVKYNEYQTALENARTSMEQVKEKERDFIISSQGISEYSTIQQTRAEEDASYVLQQLDDDLVSVELQGSTKYMLKNDMKKAASLNIPADDQIWFLPYEDHFLKAFIDRTAFIAEEIQPRLSPADKKHFWPSNPNAPQKMPSKGVRATGEVRPTIWVNGCVVGRWEMDDEGKSKTVVTSLYSKVTKTQEKKIEEVRKELEYFLNSELLPISGGK